MGAFWRRCGVVAKRAGFVNQEDVGGVDWICGRSGHGCVCVDLFCIVVICMVNVG